MRLGQVGCRPHRRMIGMGMIKADNIRSELAAFPLDTDQFPGIYVEAIVRRVIPRIATAGDRGDHSLITIEAAEQNSAAFVGIGLLTVMAKSAVVGSGNS